MPRNVRNFWLEGSADGIASRVAKGPRARDGGAHFNLYQRAAGAPTLAFGVRCYADADGTLETEVSSGADVPAIVAVSARDGGSFNTRLHFRGGFAETLAEALRCAIDVHSTAATREAERGRAGEAEAFAARAAECARILAEYFPRCCGGER